MLVTLLKYLYSVDNLIQIDINIFVKSSRNNNIVNVTFYYTRILYDEYQPIRVALDLAFIYSVERIR